LQWLLREKLIFFLLPQRRRIGMNILKVETLKRKCVTYIFAPTRTWGERMALH
jgi:AAA+ ATPase superfamily predicted ATPase